MSIEEIQSQITECKVHLDSFEALANNSQTQQLLFTGTVFASFRTVGDKEEYLKQFPTTIIGTLWAYLHYFISHYLFKNWYSDKKKKELAKAIKFSVRSAPEPADVIWENLEFNNWARLWRIFLVYNISFSIVFLNLAIVVSLNSLQVTRNY